MLAHLLGQYYFNNTTDFSQMPSKNKNNPCASKITLWLNCKQYYLGKFYIKVWMQQKLVLLFAIYVTVGKLLRSQEPQFSRLVKRESQFLSFSASRCCCMDQMKNECTSEMQKHYHVDGIWVYSDLTTVKSTERQWLWEK